MNRANLTATDFQEATGASDAVMARLCRYHALLLEWNPKINLVSSTTLDDAWRRHFLDSAQLYPVFAHSGENPTLADLGSGAGFPGMVLAIMGAQHVTLVERDVRKAAFLRTVAAETKTKIDLLNIGIQTIENRQFDVITSRALAELDELLKLSITIRKPSTHCLFLKGKTLDAELANAHKEWKMELRRMPSITDPDGFMVRLSQITKNDAKI
jgi:16S rRNA (guanine527-N7)-methyltransferase